MPKERIRKVARRLDLPIEEVIGVLARLGHGRYRLPDDTLPENVLTQLEAEARRLKAIRPHIPAPRGGGVGPPPGRPGPTQPLPAEIPDDPVLNAALREYRSARPLEALRQRLPSQVPAHTAREVAAPPRSTEDALRDSLGAEIRQRRLLSEALEDARGELARVTRGAGAQAQELEQLRQRLAEREHAIEVSTVTMKGELEALTETDGRVRRDLEAVRIRLAEELVARQVAEGRAQQLERRLRDLESRPPPPHRSAASAVVERPAPVLAPPPVSPLDEVFEQRGLLSPTEVRAAFEILLRDVVHFDFMELLATSSPAVLNHLLRKKIALMCDNCEPPEGTVPVRVEPSGRCEVCQGRSLELAVQAFLASCRARHISRVNLFGGVPRSVLELKQALSPIVTLEGIDPAAVPDLRRARLVVGEADLTVVWGGGIVDQRVAGLFRELHDARVVQVVHRGTGGMLRLATEALDRRWGRPGSGGASLFE